VEIEDPFGLDNHLALDKICATIAQDVQDLCQ
jgi:predicted membrane chloride channel (bestrophin family)